MGIRGKIKWISGVSALMLILSAGTFGEALAKAKFKAKDRKETAPNQEDYENYLKEDQSGVPFETLRQADHLRKQTITSIKELINGSMVDSQKFELYLRLGELYAERHDYLRSVEITQFEKRHDVWSKNKKGLEPTLTYKGSQAELYKSVDSFREIVRRFPNHQRTDAALFALAKTLARLGNDNTILYFEQLIKKHPKSNYIPAAHLALGEYYFDQHRIDKAIDSYKAAMSYKDFDGYIYAIYKLGWAHYNAKATSVEAERANTRKSLAAFKLVVKLADRNKKTKFNLRQEALSDLVMTWADLEGVQEAWQYFNHLGERKSFYDLLERLGNTYAEQGKNILAVQTYSRLLKEAPTRERNPRIHVQLAALHEQMNEPTSVYRDLAAMRNMYMMPNSVWIKANAANKELVKDAEEKSELYTRRHGTLFHQKGLKIKSETYLTAARNIYNLYLATFPKNENAYDIRYYYADVLFNSKSYNAASDQYLRVAMEKPKDGPHLKDAAYNAVLAMVKLDEAVKYPKLPDPGKVAQPMPLPREKKKLINVMEKYIGFLPKEDEGLKMRYTIAQTYFDYGHYEEAIKRFDGMAKDFPGTQQAQTSVKMTLSYFNQKKDWQNLIAFCKKYKASDALMKNALKPDVENNLKVGMFQIAMEYEGRKEYKNAAESFLAFQKEFPGDASADRALYNASVDFYKIADPDSAIEVGIKLLNAYPKSSLSADVMINVAQTYEALARFEEAATFYSRFYKAHDKDSRAPGALYNAALLYKGLNKQDESADLFATYIDKFPKERMHLDAIWDITMLKEQKKDYDSVVTYLNRYVKEIGKTDPDKSAYAEAKIARINIHHLNNKRGRGQMEKVRQHLLEKNAPLAYEARNFVAETFFKDLEKDILDFKSLPLKGAATIEKDVKAKQSQLLNLAKSLEEVIAIGSGEYVVASLYRLGEMHENFAESLFKVTPPNGASQIEIDQFRSSIEKVAFPLKEEAIKYYQASYARSQEVQTFTEWTKLAYNKIADLDPAKNKAINEKSASPVYMSHELIWDDGTLSSLTK